jgi:hypothetical protein
VENGLGTTVRNLNVFDGLALVIALGLVGIGFLIGTSGGDEAGASTSAELTVTPDSEAHSLAPGATKIFTVYINNPNNYGVQVTSISAGSSNATNGCAAGTVTSAPVEGPVGFIGANHVRAYDVPVTMAANAGGKCKDQTFTLPLNVTFASAAADRGFSFGSS